MAITHFLLESSFNSNILLQKTTLRYSPSFPRSSPFKSPCAYNFALKKKYSSSAITFSPKCSIKCFSVDRKPESKGFGGNRVEEDDDLNKAAIESGVNGVNWRSIEDVTKALQISVVTVVLLGFLLLYDHHHVRFALAASGGRMGGSSFSSSRSSSSTSSSSHSSSSSPSYSSSSSSPSYSSSSRSPSYSSQSIWTSSPESYTTQISSPVPANQAEPYDSSLSIAFVFVVFALVFFGAPHYEYQSTVITSVLKLQVDVKMDEEKCEKLFSQLSIEERGKFDEETLVNVNNIRRQSRTSHSSNGLRNEYIVVTILVAASGEPKLPPIKSSAQLKKALQELSSIPSSNIIATEVLWTPQKEDDSLTEEEYRQDYPLLHPL